MPAAWPPPKADGGLLLLRAGAVVMGVAIFAGLLAYHSIFFIPAPSSSPPPGSVQAYVILVRGLGFASAALLDFAAGFSVTLAWLSASRDATPETTRRGLMGFSMVFVAVWLIVSTFLFTVFRSFIFF
ncbi:MAG: hypothetical protein ACT4OI_11270 [Methanobacteriota archaeon]